MLVTDVEPRPCDEVLWRVVGPNFVAGVVVVNGLVVDAAPLFARSTCNGRRALGLYVDGSALFETVARGRWWATAKPILERLGKLERVGVVRHGSPEP